MIFNDSEFLRQEYSKIGETYEDSAPGKQWSFILNQIKDDPNKKETIQEMTRVAVAPGEEYIVYNHMWEGKNPIGSVVKDSQTSVGIYPKFEPIYERFIQEDNTYGQRLVSKDTILGYFIPFNKDKAEELHKLCNDSNMRPALKTKYYVQPEGGTKITVNSYDDWLNGDFQELYDNGKILTPAIKTQKSRP